MKRLPAIAIVALVLAACSPQAEIEVSPIFEAFVYDAEVDNDNPDARQLGLSVDLCNGDYEVEVDEATDGVLTVKVLNHSPSGDDCADSFTVHLDSPPRGKTVIDATTGNAIAVSIQPEP